ETGSGGLSLSVGRVGHTATTLLNGDVLVVGGYDGAQDLASAELYDPATGAFSPAGELSTARSGHLAFLLPNNNNVLVVGGSSRSTPLSSAELYVPDSSAKSGSFRETGSLGSPRFRASGSALKQDGLLLVAGLDKGELYGFPTVKTDKDSYFPGTPLVVSGSGWEPGETVSLVLSESPKRHSDQILTVTADGSGNISYDQWAPERHDVGVRFYLTAVG